MSFSELGQHVKCPFCGMLATLHQIPSPEKGYGWHSVHYCDKVGYKRIAKEQSEYYQENCYKPSDTNG